MLDGPRCFVSSAEGAGRHSSLPTKRAVEAAGGGDHGGGDLPGIGYVAEAVRAVRDDETDRIDCIVLDGKGIDG